ncbi:hypothetical protein GGR58DRAFT_520110 [Xylaria digitata]|nr:hypothetical protein GGR58DRAFT_520110 [Xylaria digitata]
MADSGMIPRPASHYACESYVVTVKLSNTAVEKLKKMLKKEKTFHLFPKLPPELRSMIWKRAVYTQDRLVSFLVPLVPIDHHFKIKIRDAPMPPLFLVNKEAYYESRSCYVRLDGAITADSPPAATGPLISFENDIFHYINSAPPILWCDLIWPGYKRITESTLPSYVPSSMKRCLQILYLRSLRRLALRKEDYTICRTSVFDCPQPYFSPLTMIEALAFMIDVDELRIISKDKNNQASFTRRDLEPNDFKAQRNAKRSDRAERCTKKFRRTLDRVKISRSRCGELGRVMRVMRKWSHGIIEQDLRHDHYLCQSKGGLQLLSPNADFVVYI